MALENQESTLNSSEISNVAPSVTSKLLPQEDVNDLVRMAKEKAYQKGRMEALAEIKTQVPEMQAQQVVAPPQQNGFDPNVMRNMVAEELAKKQQEMQEEQNKKQQAEFAHQTLMQLRTKISAAQQEIPDYDKVTGNYDFSKMPEVLWYANQFPNGGHLLYELSKNPSKMALIHGVKDNPDVAMAALRELSNSLEANKAAANTVLPPDPLSQVKPSTSGVDSGSGSVRDYKEFYRGRG